MSVLLFRWCFEDFDMVRMILQQNLLLMVYVLTGDSLNGAMSHCRCDGSIPVLHFAYYRESAD